MFGSLLGIYYLSSITKRNSVFHNSAILAFLKQTNYFIELTGVAIHGWVSGCAWRTATSSTMRMRLAQSAGSTRRRARRYATLRHTSFRCTAR